MRYFRLANGGAIFVGKCWAWDTEQHCGWWVHPDTGVCLERSGLFLEDFALNTRYAEYQILPEDLRLNKVL
jgi:hypothetical protein